VTWSKLKWTALFSMILGHIYAAVPVQTILLTYFKIEPDVTPLSLRCNVSVVLLFLFMLSV